MTFPTVGGRRSSDPQWHLREDYATELAVAFPGIDVRAECQSALVWVRAKPANRKTAAGMKEFLFRWMRREQDRGAGRPRGQPAAAGANGATPRQTYSERREAEIRKVLERRRQA